MGQDDDGIVERWFLKEEKDRAVGRVLEGLARELCKGVTLVLEIGENTYKINQVSSK